MDNNLQVILDKRNIAKENAKTLLAAYGAPFEEAGVILSSYKKIKVTDESQIELMKQARISRLALKKIRTGVENKRVELKADYKVVVDAIDGVAKYIKDAIQPAEEYLELQEKFAEVKQAERAVALKLERIEKLSAYSDNLSVYNLDAMDEVTFTSLLTELKAAHEAKLLAEKTAAEEAEKQRQAEIRRQKDMVAENARLKAEADKKERQREEERRAEEIQRRDFEVQREKELASERAKTEEERKKREAIEQEQRDKEAAAAQEKARAEQAERDALLAPDRIKILTFSKALESIRREKLPAVKTKQAQDIVNLIDEMLIKMQDVITKKAKDL